MLPPLYTGQLRTRDIGISGPLEAVTGIAAHLHERTPFVYLLPYPKNKPPHGVVITRIDDPGGKRALVRMNNLIQQYGCGQQMEEFYTIHTPELLDDPHLQPFRVRDLSLRAYRGVLVPLRKPRASYTEELLQHPKTQIILIGDTVDAQIAQMFASHFPVYCYQGQHTVVTYLVFPHAVSSLNWTRKLPDDLKFYKAVNLPYESTLPNSPQQRLVEERNIFAEARIAYEARKPKA